LFRPVAGRTDRIRTTLARQRRVEVMKMAEVAPMPGAGVAMAVAAKVGLRRSDRIAC
jgi:hypothetical protein